MSNQSIGLRLADHSYYPVFPDSGPARKRMVLTTIRDEQERAEITFWKGDEPLATLTLEDLEARTQGAPDIDLTLALDDHGNLEAIATERSSGNSRSLSLVLPTDARLDDAPAFDDAPFEDISFDDGPFDDAPFDDNSFDDPYRVPPSLNDSDLFKEREEYAAYGQKKRSLAPLWILLLLLLFAGAGWLFYFFMLRPAESAVPAAGAVPVEQTRPQEPAPVVTPAPVATPEPTGPVAETVPVEPAPLREISYNIIRGDTLWDISTRFYGTPWLFPAIAERNLIRNPDLIYAEDDLILPDRRYLER